jgi:enoyl-CoA hydratase/carnithine racemase
VTFSTLKVEERDRLAFVAIHRPEKLNALDATVFAELVTAFEGFRDRKEIGAVILTGSGEKAFIAGADISLLAQCDAASARENARKGQAFTRLIETLGKPVIAAINGFALGGGCEIALACTLRIAAEHAKLGQPEVKLGLICGYGGSQRLPRLVGRGRALEMLLTGDPIDAAEALRIGLVNRVVKKEELLAQAEAIARRILATGPVAVKYTIEAVDRGLDLSLEQALKLEADYFGRCFETKDMREGARAFLEKRPAKFTGE